MISPNSSAHSYWGQGQPLDPTQPVLAATPLNSVPYTGPSPPPNHHMAPPKSAPATAITPSPRLKSHPAMVFLPPHSTEDDWDKVLIASRHGVGVTGSAALGKVGPALGAIDIGESAESYLFRVSLPGVVREKDLFTCDAEPNGSILIRGITSTGHKKVVKNSMTFEMQTQNLCPPGKFSISFKLPGPVDHMKLNGVFQTDGVFEAIVKKKMP